MGCIAIGKKPTGMGEKPSDAWVTALCAYHHRTGILAQHKISEERFWFEIHGRNPFEIAARLWIESGGAARELIKPRAPRPKCIKPRKPPEQRRKIISAHRSIPGRRFDGTPIPARLVER
jgi:hypothetical protein